jgi:hypothetical protein
MAVKKPKNPDGPTLEDAVERVLLYKGRDPHSGSHRWAIVDDTFDKNRHLHWSKKLVAKARPGSLWKMKIVVNEGKVSVWSHTAEYDGMWQEPFDIERWAAEDESYGIRRRAEEKQTVEMRSLQLSERLKPVRAAYKALDAKGRAALLAMIIEEVIK